MAKHIQVVLRSDVDNLGTSGDLVKVRPGYARNFLVPRQLAVIATRGNVKQVEHERKLALVRLEKEKAEAEKTAKGFEGLVLSVSKEAGEEGKLFGSVTTADVATALKEKGFDVDKKKVVLPNGNIKELGEFDIAVRLKGGITVPIKVNVEAI